MEDTTPFATSFRVFFRQTLEQKCAMIDFCTYPGPTSNLYNYSGGSASFTYRYNVAREIPSTAQISGMEWL